MHRYFLYIKYKGTAFHGWQVQPNANSVQAEIEKAVSTIMQKELSVMGAGRTDTGVHSSCMIAHFEVDEIIVIGDFIFRINSLLPDGISIYDLRKVELDFHARFDAISRTYQYQIIQNKDPFLADYAYRFNRELDLKLMNNAAELLLGKKDFSCFSKSNTQTFTNDCDITKALWFKKGEILVFEIKANRFLRNMVRAIVGTLLEVGEHKRAVKSIPELIESKNRSNSGVSVPAKGLFLVDIEYPSEGFIE